MQQRGTYPNFKATNEHEGLAKADIDGNGIQDIIGGGYWFNYLGDDKFANNMVDASLYLQSVLPANLLKVGALKSSWLSGTAKVHSISMNTKIKHGCLKPSLKKL